MTDSVTFEIDDRVAWITLNEPDTVNALSPSLLRSLRAAIESFERSDAAVAILRGAGRGFCVGFDIGSSSPSAAAEQPSPWDDRQRIKAAADTLLSLWECPKPIVGQVHGYCLAGGLFLAMVCDVTIVARGCVFGWPRLPLGAGWIGPSAATFIGVKRAKALSFVVGSQLTAEDAVAWGLANEVVEEDSVAQRARELAVAIARTPTPLLEIKKAAFNRGAAAQSFREAFVAGVEWDALAHGTPAVEEAGQMLRQVGIREAIERFEVAGLSAPVMRSSSDPEGPSYV